jgi:hypothetical protein
LRRGGAAALVVAAERRRDHQRRLGAAAGEYRVHFRLAADVPGDVEVLGVGEQGGERPALLGARLVEHHHRDVADLGPDGVTE